MGPRTKELINVLQSLIVLLQSDNATHWAKWMSVSKSRLEASDFSGITHLLGAYGGMGSFNDLILGQDMQRGKIIWKENQMKMNEELEHLRTEAWELASNIKKAQSNGTQ